jgi:hypothetical protein
MATRPIFTQQNEQPAPRAANDSEPHWLSDGQSRRGRITMRLPSGVVPLFHAHRG